MWNFDGQFCDGRLRMKQVIVLLGTHRSGTTWLGECFSQARDVAYWPEPRQVWVYGNWFRPDDVLTAVDARENVCRYIRRRFDKFTRRLGKESFCEKTPSNCLRIAFVRSVFPEAKMVLILRDGRSVLRSTQEILERGGASWKRIGERLFEARPREWPAYLERWPWLVSKLLGRTNPFWGTRPPGWRQWLRDDPPDVFYAKQWASTISRALDDIQQVAEENRLVVRYEDLAKANLSTIEQLVAFTGIADRIRVVQRIVDSANSSRSAGRQAELAEPSLERVRPHLEPTLERLGYTW
jgi:hypothetical protein